MDKIRMLWAFHKSTLMINWLFSIAFSILLFPFFFTMLPVFSMTGGPILSLFYKEISKDNEYYFYYNRNITKLKLILVSTTINIVTGITLIIIISNV